MHDEREDGGTSSQKEDTQLLLARDPVPVGVAPPRVSYTWHSPEPLITVGELKGLISPQVTSLRHFDQPSPA